MFYVNVTAISVIELDALLAFYVDVAAPVASPLLLILLLGEALALGHNQVLVSLLRVVIGNISVAS